jgi:undecaprenyl diphosphate synthase
METKRPATLPKHIGFIMDGNRRWAKSRGLPPLEGHHRGYERLKEVGEWCLERGVPVTTFYAFSTENWNRSKREVAYLMRLLFTALTTEVDGFHRRNVRLRVIGRLSGLSREIRDAAHRAMRLTRNNTRGILNLAINYGGRTELVDAIRRMFRQRLAPVQVTEAAIARNLYTSGEPDPDLIIRTSGEQRLSNFLTWQGVYSELYFTKKHWPAFSERDLDRALTEYARRRRRFGA